MGKRSPRRGGGSSICPAGIESSYVKEVLKTGWTTKDKTTNCLLQGLEVFILSDYFKYPN